MVQFSLPANSKITKGKFGGTDAGYELSKLGSYIKKSGNSPSSRYTEFELNSNPSKYAKLIGELIIKYFKK